MKSKSLVLSIVMAASLTLSFSVTQASASQYDRHLQTSKQNEMLDRHQAEMKALREKQNAEIKEIHQLHRVELNILKEQQRQERSDFRNKR